jgi:hypothetical protein
MYLIEVSMAIPTGLQPTIQMLWEPLSHAGGYQPMVAVVAADMRRTALIFGWPYPLPLWTGDVACVSRRGSDRSEGSGHPRRHTHHAATRLNAAVNTFQQRIQYRATSRAPLALLMPRP